MKPATYHQPLRAENENEVYEIGDLLLDYLRQLGVKYIFGIPGGAIEPLYNAIGRDSRRGGIKAIVTRHETGAAFMCDGYYSNSGGILGVCCATTGPGTTNLITGCSSAFSNQIPLLFITAQRKLEDFGRGGFQDSSNSEMGVDTLGLFSRITNFNAMVSHVNQFEQVLTSSIRRAFLSPKGPVHLTIPMDVFSAKSPVKKPSYDLSSICHSSILMDLEAVDELNTLLTSGYKVVFIVGDDCANAITEIIEVATILNIYIVTTPHGKGLMSPYHPLHRGVLGFAGHQDALDVTRDPAVTHIVAIGARFGEWESNGWDKALLCEKLIHVASDSGFFNRTPMAKLHVLGDIKSIFNRTLNYLSETTFDEISVAQKKLEERIAKPADQKTRYFRLRDNEAYNDDSIPIKPQRLMKVIPRMFPYNTHYLSDIGNSMAWAIGYLHPYKSSQQRENRFSEKGIRSGVFRTCLEFGSMGWAIGASIGTAFACPGDPVVVFCGDGAFLMSGQEITVALEHHLNVVFIILNDSSLGMVKHGQKLSGAEEIGSSLPKVNFAKMARSMGITAYTIRSTQDLLELPRETITNSNAPALLDVHIDPNEVPPIDLRTNAIKQKEV